MHLARRALAPARSALRCFASKPAASASPLIRAPALEFPRAAQLSDLLFDCARANPSDDAVLFGRKVLSYEQLADRVDAMCDSLHAQGVVAGMHVGTLFDRSEWTVVVMAALFKLGAVYVPLDESYPLLRIAHMLEGGGVTCVLADEANLRKLPAAYTGRVVSLDQLTAQLGRARVRAPANTLPNTAPAYIVFTSGSTGPPKGIVLDQYSLLACIYGIHHPSIDFLRNTRTWVCIAATSFTVSLLEMWGSLCFGRRAYISKPMELDPVWYKEAASVFTQISSEGGAALQSVPLIWKGLLAGGWKGHPNSVGLSLGEQMPLDLAHTLLNLPGRIFNGYGSSEVNYSTFWELTHANKSAYPRIPIGKLSPNLHALIIDPITQLPLTLPPRPPSSTGFGAGAASEGVPIPVSTDFSSSPSGSPTPPTRGVSEFSEYIDGELWIGGPSVATGYYLKPDLTAARFVDPPASVQASGKLFATGDVVRVCRDGAGEAVLTIMGRVDDQINLGGLRVEPGEVENAIIHAARARGVPTDKVAVVARELELCACITPPPSADTCLLLQRDVMLSLPSYHVPTLWLPLPAMPTTPNRKVAKKQLRVWPLQDCLFLPDVPDRFPPVMPTL